MKLKHRVRDLIIFFISISGLGYLHRKVERKKGPLVRVIAFHDVEDVVWFEGVIRLLTEKYNVITPDDFHASRFNPNQINVLITFDDGYQSWVDNCLPILKKFNVKGTFFITSGLIEIAEDMVRADNFMREQLFVSPKKALTWDGVLELHRNGHTIGGHTYSHANLANVTREEQRKEIAEDKHLIESKTGTHLIDFAHPYGRKEHYTNETKDIVSRVGYACAFSAEPGFCQIDGDSYAIPRMLIEKEQSIFSLSQWIEGAYDIFSSMKS